MRSESESDKQQQNSENIETLTHKVPNAGQQKINKLPLENDVCDIFVLSQPDQYVNKPAKTPASTSIADRQRENGESDGIDSMGMGIDMTRNASRNVL